MSNDQTTRPDTSRKGPYNLRTNQKMTEKGKTFNEKHKSAQGDKPDEDVFAVTSQELLGEANHLGDISSNVQDRPEDVAEGNRVEEREEEIGIPQSDENAQESDIGGTDRTDLEPSGVDNTLNTEPVFSGDTPTTPSTTTAPHTTHHRPIHDDTAAQLLNFMQLMRSELNQSHDELSKKFDQSHDELNEKLDKSHEKIDKIEAGIYSHINHLTEEINLKINTKCDDLNSKIDQINANLNKNIDETKSECCQRYFNSEQKIMAHEAQLISYKQNTDEQFTDVNKTCYTLKEKCHSIESIAQQNKVAILKVQDGIDDTLKNFKEQHNREIELKFENEILKTHDENDDNDRMNELEKTLKETIEKIEKQGVSPNIYVTCMGNNNPILDNSIPTFNGRAYNPQGFLEKLKNYYFRNLNRNINKNIDETEYLKEILENGLVSHAARWWQLVKDEIVDWEHFEKLFSQKYWSRDVQRGIRQQLETEKYRPNGRLSRAEYFIRHVITLKSMTDPPSEEEIVNILAEHFDTLTQNAIQVQNIDKIQKMELLLQKADINDQRRATHRNNERRDRPRSPPRNQLNWPDQNRRPDYMRNQERDNHINLQAYRPRPPQNNRTSGYEPNGYLNNNHQSNPARSPQRNNQTYYRSNQNQNRPPYPTHEQAAVCRTISRDNRPPISNQHTASNHTQDPHSDPGPVPGAISPSYPGDLNC